MNKLFFIVIFFIVGERGHLGEKFPLQRWELIDFRFLEAQGVLNQKLKEKINFFH